MSGLNEKRVYVLCDPKIQNRDIPIQNGDSQKICFSQDGWTMGISLYIIAVIMVIDFKMFEFRDYPVPDNIQEWMKS